jgi:hypothetical protein
MEENYGGDGIAEASRNHYPEKWRKLLIMSGMPIAGSVVSLRGTGVSIEKSEEAISFMSKLPFGPSYDHSSRNPE